MGTGVVQEGVTWVVLRLPARILIGENEDGDEGGAAEEDDDDQNRSRIKPKRRRLHRDRG